MTSGEVRSIVQRAEALLDVGRPADALPLLHEVLRIDPANLHGLAGIARAHLALNDLPNAQKFAEAAIAAEPEHEWGHRLRSIVLLRRGKKRDALAAARRAAELAPHEVLVLTQLFSALRASKKKAEMREVANRMAELAPDNASSHINLGLVHLDDRRYDDAEASFRRALAIDPENWAAMNNVGAVLQRKGRHSESMEFYYRAAQLDPAPLPRNNFFIAAKKHLAGTTTAITIAILLGSRLVLATVGDRWAVIVLPAVIVAAIAIGLYERRRRMRQLREPLQRVLSEEQRRIRRYNWRRFLRLCLVIALFIVIWGVVWWWYSRNGL